MKVKRFDRGQITEVKRTPQGFLRVPITATRTGVFKYRKLDGSIVRELRHPDDVFHVDAMESLKAAPITLEHPKEMVTPKNIRQYQKGYALDDVKRDGSFVNVTGIISDHEAITDVESGDRREVSCGYYADVIDEEGEYEGEKYDSRQTNIQYNHIAVVKKGRAGPSVRVRLDASDGADESIEQQPSSEEDKTMDKVMLGGKEYECSPELASAIKEQMASMDGMKKEKDAAQAASDSAKKDKDAAQAKADALEADLKKLKAEHKDAKPKDEDIRKAVKARVSIETVARAILPKDKLEKLDDMSDLDVKKAVILVETPEVKLDEKSAEYIDVRYDLLSEKIKDKNSTATIIGQNLLTREGGTKNAANEARMKSMKADSDAWKPQEDK